MLSELSKHDKKWREIALCICKDKSLADDLTNDMYIKIHDSGKEYRDINQWYVFVVIKNLYLHHLRRLNKERCFSDVFKISEEEIVNLHQFTPKDELNTRELINEALNELGFFDREILLHTSERSLRKNEKYLGITTTVLFNSRKNALEKLKETDTIKKHKSA